MARTPGNHAASDVFVHCVLNEASGCGRLDDGIRFLRFGVDRFDIDIRAFESEVDVAVMVFDVYAVHLDIHSHAWHAIPAGLLDSLLLGGDWLGESVLQFPGALRRCARCCILVWIGVL